MSRGSEYAILRGGETGGATESFCTGVGEMRSLAMPAIVATGLLLAACSTAAPANDPLAPMNRVFFRVNEKFNKYVVLPAADLYLYKMPVRMRLGIHNAVANLELPVTFANDILQGEVNRAGETLGRFTLNSTAGLGGILDVAVRAGLPGNKADFGQTLAKYGVGEGPFLVLPILGPEPPRDLLGDAVDLAFDPLTWIPPSWPLAVRIGTAVGLHVVNPFEGHARNIFLRQELGKDSLDAYATMRSSYRQQRAREISGKASASEEIIDGETR